MHPLAKDSILNGFLELGGGIGACSLHSTHRPGIVVLPGHCTLAGGIKKKKYTPLKKKKKA